MDTCQNDAIALLPEEDWKYILDLAVANNKQTFKNCNLTCSLWFEILKIKNYQFKLPLVLPHLYPYLSGKDILNCRSVCKKWSTAVNISYPEVEPKIKLNTNQILGTIIDFFPDPLVRNNVHDVQNQREDILDDFPEFVQHNIVRHQVTRNLREIQLCFIFHTLYLTVYRNMNIRMNCLQCLKEVKAFEVHFSHGMIRKNIDMLAEILSKLPSLQYLKLSSGLAHPTERIVPRDIMDIKFPHLPGLKRLDITQISDDFQEYFIRHYKSTLVGNSRKALDTCMIMCQSEDRFWWNGPIKQLNTKIWERLATHAHFSIASENFYSSKFQDEIQRYGNALKVLSIKWIGFQQHGARTRREWGFNEWEVGMLGAQSNDNWAFSFQFLKDLRSLEQLKIQFRINEYKILIQSKRNITNRLFIIDFKNNLEDVEDLIDDDIVIRTLYKSNIWSLLPKLKRVCISIVSDEQVEEDCQMKRVYTRRELNELYPMNSYCVLDLRSKNDVY